MPDFRTIDPEVLENLLAATKGDQKIVEGILAFDVPALRKALAASMLRERNAISKMLEHQEIAKMANRGVDLHEMCDKDLTRLGDIVAAVTNALDEAGVLKIGANNATIHPADRVSRLAETVATLKEELAAVTEERNGWETSAAEYHRELDVAVKERDDAHTRAAETEHDLATVNQTVALRDRQIQILTDVVKGQGEVFARLNDILDKAGAPLNGDGVEGRVRRLVEMMDGYQQVARASSDKRLLALSVIDTHIQLADTRAALAAVRAERYEAERDDSNQTIHELLSETYVAESKSLAALRKLLA